MDTVSEFDALRASIEQLRADGASVALVPTMGNLHAGHLSLMTYAARLADHVVCSIFVNPTQFGAGEDFEDYPRTLDRDRELLSSVSCSLVFAPRVQDMYPFGLEAATRIRVPLVSAEFCGRSRPGHFDGVASVVARLLLMVRPDHAVFGQKDYQQLLVIKRLAADLYLDTRIHGAPTVRHEDGLAMSSRNQYLSVDERRIAPALAAALDDIAKSLRSGARDYDDLCEEATHNLTQRGFRMDYLAIADAHTLEPAGPGCDELVVLAAAYLGRARLIDNRVVALD